MDSQIFMQHIILHVSCGSLSTRRSLRDQCRGQAYSTWAWIFDAYFKPIPHLSISIEEPNFLGALNISLEYVGTAGDHRVHQQHVGDNHEHGHVDGRNPVARNTGVTWSEYVLTKLYMVKEKRYFVKLKKSAACKVQNLYNLIF